MSYRRIAVTFLSLTFLSLSTYANAVDHISWLTVRYEDQSVKTFLQGPYASKAICDKLNQTTWDNVLTACGSCQVEQKACMPTDDLKEVYAKVLRQKRAAFPYVVATPKGRIIISGVPTDAAIAECKLLAAKFRANGYGDARCVLP